MLQLTDTQIIDAGQTRPGRGGVDHNFWATDKMDERCYDYITEIVDATKPDLILFTGDSDTLPLSARQLGRFAVF